MDIAIIGGGIDGLSLAIKLHDHDIAACVFERVPEIRELGIGITLLLHAMREFAALGVAVNAAPWKSRLVSPSDIR